MFGAIALRHIPDKFRLFRFRNGIEIGRFVGLCNFRTVSDPALNLRQSPLDDDENLG